MMKLLRMAMSARSSVSFRGRSGGRLDVKVRQVVNMRMTGCRSHVEQRAAPMLYAFLRNQCSSCTVNILLSS